MGNIDDTVLDICMIRVSILMNRCILDDYLIGNIDDTAIGRRMIEVSRLHK